MPPDTHLVPDVLLAHRHAIVREGTRRILESEQDFQVVAETLSLESALPLVEALKPDVLILGVDPTEIDSSPYVRHVRAVLLATRVLVLDYGASPQRLASLGVSGWLAGTASPGELIAGIRAVLEGRRLQGDVDGTPWPRMDLLPAEHPTPRELEVLRLVEKGLNTRAIADILHTSPRTIHFHVANLFNKLGARSRTEMVHLSRRRGWLE